MRDTVTTAAASSPVSVEEAADHCYVTDAAEYPMLRTLVDRAVEYVEAHTSRQCINATHTLYLDGFPAEIKLPVLPVSSVTSIAYTDTDGDSQTLSSSNYQTQLRGNDNPAIIKPAYGCSWPSTRGDTFNVVTIVYVAGYGSSSSDVPHVLRAAVLLLAKHWYDQRDPLDERTQNSVPHSLDSLLSLGGWGVYS